MKDEKMYLLWTNGDTITSEHMVMMYATNGMLNSWWDEVTVIIWGASGPALLKSEALKVKMEVAQEAGVHFSACVSCANNLGITKDLEELGVEVIRWGEKLSNLMKDGAHIISI